MARPKYHKFEKIYPEKHSSSQWPKYHMDTSVFRRVICIPNMWILWKKIGRSASLKCARGRHVQCNGWCFLSLIRHTYLIYVFQVAFGRAIWALLPYCITLVVLLKCRSALQISYMAQSTANNMVKKLIRIDITSDTVCPWCCVGKKNLDNAIGSSKIHYDFKVILLLSFHYLINTDVIT